MSALGGLESKLTGPFGKDAPVKIPENGKKALVQWLPWLALIFGILQGLLALMVFNWARVSNDAVNYVNALCSYSGVNDCGVNVSRWSLFLWIALIATIAEAVLLLMAFPGLRDRKKTGWNLLFYSVLLNFVIGIVYLFTDYTNKVGSFIGAIIGVVIGLWLLFQVRDHYTGRKAEPTAPKA